MCWLVAMLADEIVRLRRQPWINLHGLGSRACSCHPPCSPDAAAANDPQAAGQTAAALKKEKRKRPKVTLELLQVGLAAHCSLPSAVTARRVVHS